MKRTAKWQKHLTIKQLKHLAENGKPTIKSVVANIVHQRKLKAEGTPFPCHECTAISNRLHDAGVIDLKVIHSGATA